MSPPSVRPPRFAASRRRLGANTRNALGPLLFLLKVVDQSHVRIKAKNLQRVRNKIGKGINVVINNAAIAIVDDVFNAAHVDLRGTDDFFNCLNYFLWGRVTLHFQSGLRCINEAHRVGGGSAVFSSAYLSRTQIKVLSRGVDFDRIQKFSTESLDARNMSATDWKKLLNESGVIDPKTDFAGRGCALQRRRRIKTHDTCAPAADIWFDDDRKSNLLCCGNSLDRAIHDTRARRRQSQGVQERELRCLRNLERKGFAAVDDTYSNTLEVCEIVAREEDALCVTAQVGGR